MDDGVTRCRIDLEKYLLKQDGVVDSVVCGADKAVAKKTTFLKTFFVQC